MDPPAKSTTWVSNEPRDATMAAIDREIEGGFFALVFSPNLERCYEEDTRPARERYVIRTTLLAAVLFDLFLLSDWLIERDVFWIAVVARVFIFTPLLLITCLVFGQSPPRWLREGLASVLTVGAVTATMSVLSMSESPDRIVYQAGDVLIIVFATVVQRLQIRYAVAAIVGVLVVQLTASANLSDMTPRLMVNTVLYFTVGSILLLWATYVLEREQRRSYLLELRSRLLTDHLDRIAKQDALTGLWNRRHLKTVVTSAWATARDQPRPISIILLDIDHFKTFNDSYGHLEGDVCLKRVAASVLGALRDEPEACAVRFGGEEFLILIDGADSGAAKRTAERIRTEIRRAAVPHPTLGEGRIVTASFGVATGPAPDVLPDALVAAADDALYVAKREGRDRVSRVVIGTGQASPHHGGAPYRLLA